MPLSPGPRAPLQGLRNAKIASLMSASTYRRTGLGRFLRHCSFPVEADAILHEQYLSGPAQRKYLDERARAYDHRTAQSAHAESRRQVADADVRTARDQVPTRTLSRAPSQTASSVTSRNAHRLPHNSEADLPLVRSRQIGTDRAPSPARSQNTTRESRIGELTTILEQTRLTSFFVRPGYGERGRPVEVSSNYLAVRPRAARQNDLVSVTVTRSCGREHTSSYPRLLRTVTDTCSHYDVDINPVSRSATRRSPRAYCAPYGSSSASRIGPASGPTHSRPAPTMGEGMSSLPSCSPSLPVGLPGAAM